MPSSRPVTYDDELQLASEAARNAGRLQMERYERLERIVHKTEHDVVTEVDEMSEEMIISAIRASYPQDAFLAEESGRSHVVAPAGVAFSEAQRLWIIDPLDGTVNYANGIPVFCVSIGLVVEGRPVAGVIYDPVRDELYSAQAGRGARLDGRAIRLPVKDRMSDLVISLALPRRGWSQRERSVRGAIRVSRSMGSAALTLAYVANGRFDAFVQSGGLSLWDICAAGLIAAEGGARVTTLNGASWFDLDMSDRSIGLLAAAPVHHQKMLEMLK
ncbi:MAG TPA: inositol monophosphatase family protein [Candidatus Limnocylindria bacterium]|nr:inositol monophosphatase family protein [Candidatus Limnocylindria bacterium]